MGILGRSSEIEAAIYEFHADRQDPSKANKVMDLWRPFILTIVEKHPIWLRDDLQQELGMVLHRQLPAIVDLQRAGKVRRLIPYIIGVLDKRAISWVRAQIKENDKFVPIDDALLDVAVHPSENKDGVELLAYVRKAVNVMIRARFKERSQATRASRWAQILLAGKRPRLETNHLAQFNGTRYQAAKHMYSIVLHRIRELFLAGGVQ